MVRGMHMPPQWAISSPKQGPLREFRRMSDLVRWTTRGDGFVLRWYTIRPDRSLYDWLVRNARRIIPLLERVSNEEGWLRHQKNGAKGHRLRRRRGGQLRRSTLRRCVLQ